VYVETYFSISVCRSDVCECGYVCVVCVYLLVCVSFVLCCSSGCVFVYGVCCVCVCVGVCVVCVWGV